jgi:hypothetical protein
MSAFSACSAGSIGSFGSAGSIGSVLSAGSIGSALSAGAIGGVLRGGDRAPGPARTGATGAAVVGWAAALAAFAALAR